MIGGWPGRLTVVLVVLALGAALPAGASAFTFSPTRFDDPSSGGTTCAYVPGQTRDCSLRGAITAAAGHNGGATVSLQCSCGGTGPYMLTQGTLGIGNGVTLAGLGARTSEIEQTTGGTVLTVDSGATVAISGVTITGGTNGGQGGGIDNAGTLTLQNSTVTANSAQFGAGIFSSGTLTVIGSTVSDNEGGGPPATYGYGGGLFINSGTAEIVNSTISGNSVAASSGPGEGGGIANSPNTTISLANVTLASNSSTDLGGNLANIGTVSAKNTIIANGSPDNCGASGISTSLGHNLSDGNDCNLTGTGDQQNTDPKLGPLQDNGGQTDTQAESPDGPTVDHGDPSGCTDPNAGALTVDQRGDPRPEGLACDIGAYEFQPVAPGVSGAQATTVGSRTAAVIGSVDTHGFQTSWHFEYGPTSAYGYSTPTQTLTGGGTHPVAAPLTGLQPGTTYHFRLVGSTSGGQASTTDQTFTTSPEAPGVTTGVATTVTRTMATLNGTVVPGGAPTTYEFRYGTTTTYGHTTAAATAGQGTSPVAVTAALSGLKPGHTYRFELVATNAKGTRTGANRRFTTPGPPTLTGFTITSALVISYIDSEHAKTTFVIKLVQSHHRSKTIDTFSHADHAGRNKFQLAATLAPGNYTITGTARNASGLKSRPLKHSFRIQR